MNEFPPISDKFSTTIASRVFELSHSAGVERVTVDIGLPVKDVETINGYDWRCPVKIIIGNKTINDRACGSDSFQALSIAMGPLIKSRLKSIAQNREVRILHL